MADQFATSFTVVNYSGLLFNKGNTRVPFSTLIANRARNTNHVEFVTGQEFTTGGGDQPNISENQSLTAPPATRKTREQKKNVTQIFHEAVGISYGKQSNMGTLHGLNIAGQTANPANELDFQVAAKMAQIARDIEFTFMQGTYALAANDDQANRTRGIMPAITSNIVDIQNRALTVWDVAEAIKVIHDGNAPISDLVLWVDPVALFHLNKDAELRNTNIVPSSRVINGLQLQTLLTPLGAIDIYLGQFLPAGSVGLFNPSVVGRVEQPVPEKGNFFMEELAKTGAGAKYQIFGQVGLDHGPEWYHAKIVGINPNFDAPEPGTRIYTTGPIETAAVFPVLDSATIETAIVDTSTGVPTVTYKGTPMEAVSLAYAWYKLDGPTSTPVSLSNTSSAYTPTAELVGKFLKVKVTAASGGAVGEVWSKAKQVKALDVVGTAEILDNAPAVIDITLDEDVDNMTTSNFEVEKNGAPYATFTAAKTNAKSYQLTMSDAAIETDSFIVTIEEDGYAIDPIVVDNQVE